MSSHRFLFHHLGGGGGAHNGEAARLQEANRCAERKSWGGCSVCHLGLHTAWPDRSVPNLSVPDKIYDLHQQCRCILKHVNIYKILHVYGSKFCIFNNNNNNTEIIKVTKYCTVVYTILSPVSHSSACIHYHKPLYLTQIFKIIGFMEVLP